MKRREFAALTGATVALPFLVRSKARALDAGVHEIALSLNERSLELRGARIVHNRAFIPVGPAHEALGNFTDYSKPVPNNAQDLFRQFRAFLGYDPATRSVSVVKGQMVPVKSLRSLQLTVGRHLGKQTYFEWPNATGTTNTAYRPVTTTVPVNAAPFVDAGVVYIPLRSLAEAAGAYVEWQPANRAIAMRILPPSAQELALEAEALRQVSDVSRHVRESLDQAAQNLK